MGGRGYIPKRIKRMTDKQSSRANPFKYDTKYGAGKEAVIETYVEMVNGTPIVRTRVWYRKRNRNKKRK